MAHPRSQRLTAGRGRTTVRSKDGAVLTAQGGSTVQGLPNMSGPSPAQAAQRNYLQALHAEVAEKGVYVGMLYVGAAIKNSAFHAEMEKAKAAGDPVWEMPIVDPEHLADLLWTMHGIRTAGSHLSVIRGRGLWTRRPWTRPCSGSRSG
jgi:short-subunit dehydrogenase